MRDGLFGQHVDMGKARSFRAALCGIVASRQRPCSGYVSGALVFYNLRRRDRSRESGDQANTGEPVDWAGIRADEGSQRREATLVPEAYFLGGRG